ncbi:MAG: molybdate ABC transporter permease subunit [Ignavibacteriaceae bacterium]
MTNLNPILLSFELAGITTFILLIISIPLAYWLSTTNNKSKPIVDTFVSMPLVLPPSVLGFYLLVAFSPANFFGAFLQNIFNIRLVFSFGGLIIASLIYSLPFMVQPLQSGLESLPKSLNEAAETLGKGRLSILFKVLLPNIKPSLLTGIVLSFAHTIGEFGVVLMIGGNIPGKTRVASIAIYDEVESLNYHNANVYALILFLITFLILLTVYYTNHKYFRAGRT